MNDLGSFPLRRPGRTLALAGLALLVSAGLLSRLDYLTDVTELLPTPAARTLVEASRVFGMGQQAFLLVEADAEGREGDLLRFARELRAALESVPEVASVEWSLPLGRDAVIDRLLLPYGLLYGTPDEVRAALSAEGMQTTLEAQASRLALLGMGEADAWAERDPLDIHRGLLRRVRTLEGSAKTAGGDEMLSADGRALLVTVYAAGDQGGGMEASRRVVVAIETARERILAAPWARGVTAEGMGAPYLSEESERVIRGDVLRSFGASIALALVLLAVGLRLPPRAVVLLLVPTLWGTAVGGGLFALLRPSLAVLSLGCSAILVGLGIDFTVHLTAAARTARARGLSTEEAIATAIRETRGALGLAAFSSAAAFVAFLGSEQKVLQDMGLLTACGLLACLAGALFLLPVLLLRSGLGAGDQAPRSFGVLAIAGRAIAWPRSTLALAAGVSLLAGAWLAHSPPGLEGDLRRLQADGSRPLAVQDRVEALFGGSLQPLVLLVRGDSPQAAADACQRLEPALAEMIADGLLTSRASIAALLPPTDAQAAVLEALAKEEPAAVRARFLAALDAVGFDPASFAEYADGLAAACALDAPLTLARAEALGLDRLSRRFVRADETGEGFALVLLYPQGELWSEVDRRAVESRLHAAVAAAEVSASLGGFPLLAGQSSRLVATDFARIALWTVLAVVAGLLVRFRHPGRVALVLLPAGLGTLWTAALFSLLGLSLNLMNLAVLPMVLAIGVDDGIHVMHRLERSRGPLLEALGGTAVAVMLTSLTTMVTFGSLALSRNPGIASVGLLSFLGIGCCLLITIAVLPAALSLLPGKEEPSS